MLSSKSQIDRLGERLKSGDPTEADLRLLDEYRRSFGEAYEFVVQHIQTSLGRVPSGRRAKTTNSIIDKLRRESIRLSQIQDIAGCRLVVDNLDQQDDATRTVSEVLDDCVVVDRRRAPSHGYRAVHVITQREGKAVEIQIRTGLQHVWAQLSEKMSDAFGTAVKYGGGPPGVRDLLQKTSAATATLESLVRQVARPTPDHLNQQALETALNEARGEYFMSLQAIISQVLEP